MFKWFGKVNYTPYTKVSEFARHLREGRLMASRCTACGTTSFPPRADCGTCMSDAFEFVEVSGRGTLHTYTRIVAAPTGFDDVAPYTLGVVDMEEGGKALAWIGETIPEDDVEIGMEVQLVPRIFDETEEIKVDYTVERPGTTWTKAEAGAMATAGTG